MKEKNEFEIFCYESENGAIRLEFGEAVINFSRKHFLAFADKLNEMRQNVLQNYLQRKSERQEIVNTQ